MAVESLRLKMENMPRVKAEAGEYVIIETTYGGKTISEVICYVEALEFSVSNGIASKVKLNVFNPHVNNIVTNSYELKTEKQG